MHPDDHHHRPWSTLAAAGPVSARVRLPASKSITNRALVLAALSDGPAAVANPLAARDTLLAVGALRALGTQITGTDSLAVWRVTPGQPRPALTSAWTWATPGPSCGSCPGSRR